MGSDPVAVTVKLTGSPTRTVCDAGCSTIVGGVSGAEVTVNPPAIEKVSVPRGVVKTTAASLAPSGSSMGMSNTAVTMYCVGCATEVPTRLPIVTLSGSTPAGGGAGSSLSSVKVTSSPVVPCSAESGLISEIWFMPWARTGSATVRHARRVMVETRFLIIVVLPFFH